MRVVLDTNVLISIAKGPERDVMGAIYKAIKNGTITIVFCKETYDELSSVLKRDKFRKLQRTVVNQFMSLLSSNAYWCTAKSHGPEAPDGKDQPFIDVAIAADCTYLVTGNLRDMPDGGTTGHVKIVSPREFVTMEKLI